MKQKLEQLMVEHLNQVWNQRDEVLRMKAIKSIYAEDIVMFDMDDETFSGYDAISQKVASLLNSLPPDFSINQSIPIVLHNDVGKLEWGVGPTGAPSVLTGTDIVFFKDDKIKSFYVFVNIQK
ncbi:nuclear transport factor 2 family protein [Mucilaginibacter sp. cycad4]|uniref:nuclear transport factor 2 family protein n=1 Tax=Mucilaginibacter sp. cycad4 TaxID=3342096 RepID=UPI002AAAB44A|nr:nuclear transport factor 2 family protein [Mucilaginibacter gossypii]WPV01928.1 nuclear transport factor 2 family protein [Mucilaginibacter gossypii]